MARSPDDQQGAFLARWMQSHLDAAKAIGKPLLFEEFGKALDNPDAASIAQLRDPVFRAAYQYARLGLRLVSERLRRDGGPCVRRHWAAIAYTPPRPAVAHPAAIPDPLPHLGPAELLLMH